MTTHVFALGQTVRMMSGYQPSGAVYFITALLPPEGGSPQYRMRNEAESFERMTTEANLEGVTATSASLSLAFFQSSLSPGVRRRLA